MAWVMRLRNPPCLCVRSAVPSKGGRLREGSASLLPSGLHSRSGHRIITARDFPPGVKGEARPDRGGLPGNGLDSPFRTGNAVPWSPPAAQKSSFSCGRDAAPFVSNGLRWGSGAGGRSVCLAVHAAHDLGTLGIRDVDHLETGLLVRDVGVGARDGHAIGIAPACPRCPRSGGSGDS